MMNYKIDLKREIKIMGAGVICALIFSGCSNAPAGVNGSNFANTENSTSFFAMDTVMDLKIYGSEDLLVEAESKVNNLEDRLSVTNPESEISIINRDKIGRLSKESAEILEGALEVCRDTDGALDVSIYPVLKDWGFTTGEYRIPEETEIEDLLENVDYKKIAVNNAKDGSATVEIPEGMEIDLGSVVKGYTGQMLAEYFKENGVESAIINLGGNVQCLGKKPNGEKWNIAIKSPFLESKSGILGVLKAEDTSVITSGGYERYFEQDGHIYWHIIDPATGSPANKGLASVTIIGDNGLRGDALSTALFVKGFDEAIQYWKDHGDFEAIFVNNVGDVFITEGLEGNFELSSEYVAAKLTIIKK